MLRRDDTGMDRQNIRFPSSLSPSRGLRAVAQMAATAAVTMTAQHAMACYGIPCTPVVCTHAANDTAAHARAAGRIEQALAPSQNMVLLGRLTLAQMGGTGTNAAGSSLYGWTDPLTKREYAIMGRDSGTAFIDVTVPTSPRYVGELPKIAGTSSTSWREPKVYQNTVYIGVDGTSAGMQVMDLTKLRAYQGTTLSLTSNAVYNNVTKVHTLAINPDSGYLYADGTKSESTGLGGMHVIDVRNPNAPAFVTEYNGDNYTHESQVVTYHGPDTAYQGKEIAFNSNGKSSSANDTFSIVDLSNKSSITRIASKSYPNAKFIHQGWLTEDQKYFFQNDELDEQSNTTGGHTRTHLWDVSDLDNPVYKGFYDHVGGAIDHNLYTKGGFLFETNYTQGLRMLKIGDLSSSNPSDWLQEVAYYDTYAPTDAGTFDGAWNNFPFFKSGNIIVSDIEGGLFVIQPRVNGWKLGAAGPMGGNGGNTGAGGQSVPEPTSAMICLGALAIGAMRRRTR